VEKRKRYGNPGVKEDIPYVFGQIKTETFEKALELGSALDGAS